MVMVAAIALASSTYAWFAAQNTVTADGMSVKAQAESGIVIKSVDNTQSNWATTASANMTEATALKPTTTADLKNWYHNVSDDRTNAKGIQASETYGTPINDTTEYLVKKSFIIRSAADGVPVSNVKLGVKSVEVKVPSTQNSQALNKALRVGIRLASDTSSAFYIYAPLMDSDSTITHKMTYASDTNVSWYKKATPAEQAFTLTGSQIPATDDGVKVDVYIWFEGEDDNCKSENVTATLDDLGVTVQFETVAL